MTKNQLIEFFFFFFCRSPSDAERDQLFSRQPEFRRFDDVMSQHNFQFHFHEKQVRILKFFALFASKLHQHSF
jgi:hypothetical protein